MQVRCGWLGGWDHCATAHSALLTIASWKDCIDLDLNPRGPSPPKFFIDACFAFSFSWNFFQLSAVKPAGMYWYSSVDDTRTPFEDVGAKASAPSITDAAAMTAVEVLMVAEEEEGEVVVYWGEICARKCRCKQLAIVFSKIIDDGSKKATSSLSSAEDGTLYITIIPCRWHCSRSFLAVVVACRSSTPMVLGSVCVRWLFGRRGRRAASPYLNVAIYC